MYWYLDFKLQWYPPQMTQNLHQKFLWPKTSFRNIFCRNLNVKVIKMVQNYWCLPVWKRRRCLHWRTQNCTHLHPLPRDLGVCMWPAHIFRKWEPKVGRGDAWNWYTRRFIARNNLKIKSHYDMMLTSFCGSKSEFINKQNYKIFSCEKANFFFLSDYLSYRIVRLIIILCCLITIIISTDNFLWTKLFQLKWRQWP